jgi:hypothetical protein
VRLNVVIINTLAVGFNCGIAFLSALQGEWSVAAIAMSFVALNTYCATSEARAA